MSLERGKMEPPEMAVFSFIDLPDVLTKKRKTHHETKETLYPEGYTKDH